VCGARRFEIGTCLWRDAASERPAEGLAFVCRDRWLGLFIISVLALSACVNPGAQQAVPSPASPLVTSTPPGMPAAAPTSTPPIVSTQPPSTGGEPPSGPVSSDPAAAAEVARNLLAAELNIPPDSITTASALPVQWNDSSLGCPQPGQVYLPVVTAGYLVTLSVGGTDYNVHTDLNGVAVLCTQDGDPVGPGTVRDPIVAEFIDQARADLAARLAIAPQAIVLVRSEAVEWADSSLGCPLEGEEYIQALTAGYRILLAVGDAYYEYHTDQQRMLLCENPTE
jgi:hypothetical protein